jgi:hypothetical protein
MISSRTRIETLVIETPEIETYPIEIQLMRSVAIAPQARLPEAEEKTFEEPPAALWQTFLKNRHPEFADADLPWNGARSKHAEFYE